MSDDTVGDAPDHNPQTSAVPGTGPGQNLPATQPRKAQLVVNEKGWIAPNTVEEAARMAQAVIAGNLAPSSYNNDPNKIMLGIMAALEAGLPPLYGIRQIAIINGRPTIWGDAAMALIQSKNLLSNQTVEEVGTKPSTDTALADWPDDFGFKVSLWRRGQTDPYVGIFTVADAKRAHLWIGTQSKAKLPWIEHPLRMLTIRARAWAQRDGFADALAGLAIREEVDDMIITDGEAVDQSFLGNEPIVEAPPMPEEKAVEKTDE